jgi:hypothetical protein
MEQETSDYKIIAKILAERLKVAFGRKPFVDLKIL